MLMLPSSHCRQTTSGSNSETRYKIVEMKIELVYQRALQGMEKPWLWVPFKMTMEELAMSVSTATAL